MERKQSSRVIMVAKKASANDSVKAVDERTTHVKLTVAQTKKRKLQDKNAKNQEKSAKLQEKSAKRAESKRRSAAISKEDMLLEGIDYTLVQPVFLDRGVVKCNQTFYDLYNEREPVAQWKTYAAMVSHLDREYGQRPIKGWIRGPRGVWTAPQEETWKPLRTPDIQDIFDVDDFGAEVLLHNGSRKGYDAIDAWTRWFYPLKHFFCEALRLTDDSDGNGSPCNLNPNP